MVFSAPTILRPWVRIPSRPSTLFSIYIIEIATRKKQKEAGIGQFFKNLQSKFVSSVLTIYLLAYLLSIRRYGVRSCCIDRQSDSL